MIQLAEMFIGLALGCTGYVLIFIPRKEWGPYLRYVFTGRL